jgi:lipid II:glycine glycyltransferase (peptidoglycan interpeptide bridge formation enzyme)
MSKGGAPIASAQAPVGQAHSEREGYIASVSTRASDWDRAVSERGGGLLQSWRWGEFKKASGWYAFRLMLGERESMHGPSICGQVLFRSVPKLPLPVSIAYMPRGPVSDRGQGSGVRDQGPEFDATLNGSQGDVYSDGRAIRAFWQRVHAEARKRGAVFLKVEPDVPLDEHTTREEIDRDMQALGFRPSGRLQPARTIVLDIDRSEDDLLKEMKPKTRYNLRLAGRRGVQVRRAETLDDLRTFYTLLEVTGDRDEFGIHTFPYYEQLWRTFGPEGDNSVLVLLAEHPDAVERAQGPIAGLLALRFGREAIYMYGASANRGREHMPNYLLQWEAVKWAKEHGCARYDFWGIPDAPTEEAGEGEVSPINARSGLRGVYWFKKGFGGREIEYPGAYDYVYNPLLYKLWMRWRGANLG